MENNTSNCLQIAVSLPSYTVKADVTSPTPTVNFIGIPGPAGPVGPAGVSTDTFAGLSTGLLDAYNVTIPSLTAMVTGILFIFLAHRDCGPGPVTMQINNFGNFPLCKNGSADLSAPDILAGEAVLVVYDGEKFQAICGVAEKPLDGGTF